MSSHPLPKVVVGASLQRRRKSRGMSGLSSRRASGPSAAVLSPSPTTQSAAMPQLLPHRQPQLLLPWQLSQEMRSRAGKMKSKEDAVGPCSRLSLSKAPTANSDREGRASMRIQIVRGDKPTNQMTSRSSIRLLWRMPCTGMAMTPAF